MPEAPRQNISPVDGYNIRMRRTVMHHVHIGKLPQIWLRMGSKTMGRAARYSFQTQTGRVVLFVQVSF